MKESNELLPESLDEAMRGGDERRFLIPRQHVVARYHNQGFIDNLDDFKADHVLMPNIQQAAQRILGSSWKNMKPSAILKSLGLVKEAALLPESSDDAFQQYATIQEKLSEVIDALEVADHYQWSLAHIGDVERSAQMIVDAAKRLRKATGRVDVY